MKQGIFLQVYLKTTVFFEHPFHFLHYDKELGTRSVFCHFDLFFSEQIHRINWKFPLIFNEHWEVHSYWSIFNIARWKHAKKGSITFFTFGTTLSSLCFPFLAKNKQTSISLFSHRRNLHVTFIFYAFSVALKVISENKNHK